MLRAHLPAVGEANTDASAVASPLRLRLAGDAPKGLAGPIVKAEVGEADRISRATGENLGFGIVAASRPLRVTARCLAYKIRNVGRARCCRGSPPGLEETYPQI